MKGEGCHGLRRRASTKEGCRESGEKGDEESVVEVYWASGRKRRGYLGKEREA